MRKDSMNSNTKNDPDNTARTHPAASKAAAPLTRGKPGGQSQSPDGIRAAWTELEIHGHVSNLSPTLWTFVHLTKLSLKHNSIAYLPPDIMRLQSLVFLDASSNKLQSLPAEIGELISLKELLLNNNCLSHLPFELGKLFQLQKLGLKGNPLPTKYINLCNDSNGLQNLLGLLLDSLGVQSTPLPERPWVPLLNPDSLRPVAMFTVMCYNVLSDKYCTRQLYGYCPPWALTWEYRKKTILAEIKRYHADILSLQEVETEQFYNFLKPELEADGYKGIFSPKSRARTMSEADRKHVDGCAIFYRNSKFRAIKEHLVEFNQLAIETADGFHEMINRVMTKDNIGLAVLLETTEGIWEGGLPADGKVNQPLLVATCHVHWDPEFCDVKLIQTMMLINKLQGISKDAVKTLRPEMQNPDCNGVPLILCGDFNSLPDSGVVEYLTRSCIDSKHSDFKAIDYKDCLSKLSLADSDDTYTHGFRLAQAYSKDYMPYTNYTYDFKGIIDYIFYSRDTMHCLGILGSPDAQWFADNHVLGCPHPQIPSDHLPLLAQFEMNSNSAASNRNNSSSSTASSTTMRR